ncbi:MAG: hypothetical protein H7X94_05445 [Vallitaleaceae bacterium]|nr:hypothetical protein [Vallitaleaceae bacterium]
MIDKMFDSKNVIHKALDAATIRNTAISQNLANIDTPNFKRKMVSFEEELKKVNWLWLLEKCQII